jgi:hypothetical protein
MKTSRQKVKAKIHTYTSETGGLRCFARIAEEGRLVVCGTYTTRFAAKRGMERFMRRIGADPSKLDWSGQ